MVQSLRSKRQHNQRKETLMKAPQSSNAATSLSSKRLSTPNHKSTTKETTSRTTRLSSMGINYKSTTSQTTSRTMRLTGSSLAAHRKSSPSSKKSSPKRKSPSAWGTPNGGRCSLRESSLTPQQKKQSSKKLPSPKHKSTTGQTTSRTKRCSLSISSSPQRRKTANKKSSPTLSSKRLSTPNHKSTTKQTTSRLTRLSSKGINYKSTTSQTTSRTMRLSGSSLAAHRKSSPSSKKSSPKRKSPSVWGTPNGGRCSLRESSLTPQQKKQSSKKLSSPKHKSTTGQTTSRTKRCSLSISSSPQRRKTANKKSSPTLLKKADKAIAKDLPSPTQAFSSTPMDKPCPRQSISSVKKNRKVKLVSLNSDNSEQYDSIRTSFRKTPAPLRSRQSYRKDLPTNSSATGIKSEVSIKSPAGSKKKRFPVHTLPSMTPKPQEPCDILKENLKKNVASELKTLSMSDSTPTWPRKSHDECAAPSKNSPPESPVVPWTLLNTPVSSRKSSLRESNRKRRRDSLSEESFNGTPMKWKKSDLESRSSYFTSVSKSPVRKISHSEKTDNDDLPYSDHSFATQLEESSIEGEIASHNPVISSKNSILSYCVLM